ncbi:MAG: tripartite tricarboxylate transporter TctB family protein [Spirochaetota bacterium]
MKKPGAGVWGALTTTVIGVGFFAYSFKYKYDSPIGPGPGFFARWLSGLLILLSVVYLVEALRGHDSSDKPEAKGMLKVLLIIITMAVYVLLLPLVGFSVASAAFLFALMLKAYKWHVNLAISAVSAIAIYFLFGALGVQLPLNALGF